MDGDVRGSSARKPRMLGRQIYTYAMGYLLTGDESLLELARAGARWLLDHAWDPVHGGWHADLDAAGDALGSGDKTAQDMSYAAMGAAAYFFVTRDAEAEAAVLVTRDLLFDPAKLWDATHARIRDAMDASLTVARSSGAAGAAELVSQLDPATAFLLLVQPVLTDAARREQVLGDLRALATAMRDDYWQDGMFWSATDLIGRYGTAHSDFGHTLKAYWALTQIDKRLPDHPLADFLAENAPAAVLRAYDAPYGRWASAPVSKTEVSYGTEWWAYAESDQLTAALALHDASLIPILEQTAPHFRSDYVDRTRPARELVPLTRRDGSWATTWADDDLAKCNDWKNGFHGTEHAVVMTLFGHWLAGSAAPLYFAFPADELASLAAAARPYTFLGRVVKVEDLGPLQLDTARHKVRVVFDELR